MLRQRTFVDIAVPFFTSQPDSTVDIATAETYDLAEFDSHTVSQQLETYNRMART